jgi:hypothetical protein
LLPFSSEYFFSLAFSNSVCGFVLDIREKRIHDISEEDADEIIWTKEG